MASAQEADEKEVLEEVEARTGMIKPVIAAKVRAAHDEVTGAWVVEASSASPASGGSPA